MAPGTITSAGATPTAVITVEPLKPSKDTISRLAVEASKLASGTAGYRPVWTTRVPRQSLRVPTQQQHPALDPIATNRSHAPFKPIFLPYVVGTCSRPPQGPTGPTPPPSSTQAMSQPPSTQQHAQQSTPLLLSSSSSHPTPLKVPASRGPYVSHQTVPPPRRMVFPLSPSEMVAPTLRPVPPPAWTDPLGFTVEMLPVPCAFLRLPWPPDQNYCRLVPTHPGQTPAIVDSECSAHHLIVKRMFVERTGVSPSAFLVRYVHSPSLAMWGTPSPQDEERIARVLIDRSQNAFPSNHIMGLGFAAAATLVAHLPSQEAAAAASGKDDVCLIYFRLKLSDLPFRRRELEEDWNQRRSEIHPDVSTIVVVFDFRFSELSPLGGEVWSPASMRKLVHLTAQTQSILDAWLVHNLQGRDITIIHLPPPSFAEVVDRAISQTPIGVQITPPTPPTIVTSFTPPPPPPPQKHSQLPSAPPLQTPPPPRQNQVPHETPVTVKQFPDPTPWIPRPHKQTDQVTPPASDIATAYHIKQGEVIKVQLPAPPTQAGGSPRSKPNKQQQRALGAPQPALNIAIPSVEVAQRLIKNRHVPIQHQETEEVPDADVPPPPTPRRFHHAIRHREVPRAKPTLVRRHARHTDMGSRTSQPHETPVGTPRSTCTTRPKMVSQTHTVVETKSIADPCEQVYDHAQKRGVPPRSRGTTPFPFCGACGIWDTPAAGGTSTSSDDLVPPAPDRGGGMPYDSFGDEETMGGVWTQLLQEDETDRASSTETFSALDLGHDDESPRGAQETFMPKQTTEHSDWRYHGAWHQRSDNGSLGHDDVSQRHFERERRTSRNAAAESTRRLQLPQQPRSRWLR